MRAIESPEHARALPAALAHPCRASVRNTGFQSRRHPSFRAFRVYGFFRKSRRSFLSFKGQEGASLTAQAPLRRAWGFFGAVWNRAAGGLCLFEWPTKTKRAAQEPVSISRRTTPLRLEMKPELLMTFRCCKEALPAVADPACHKPCVNPQSSKHVHGCRLSDGGRPVGDLQTAAGHKLFLLQGPSE